MPRDPTSRFSDRVEAYVRYRPSYPPDLVALLEQQCGLHTPRRIADIGSGTGILTKLLLERGHHVYGVEPNDAMRAAAERLLGDFSGFVSVKATAESTALPSSAFHLVIAAQAFHWFDPVATRQEFQRILRAAGWVALVWNDRRKQSTPFQRDYERLLLTHGTDYRQVDHSRIGNDELRAFFGPSGYRSVSFDNAQPLDFGELGGRLLSTSYVPAKNDPGYPAMAEELRQIFDAHQVDGRVTLEYDTRILFGRFS